MCHTRSEPQIIAVLDDGIQTRHAAGINQYLGVAKVAFDFDEQVGAAVDNTSVPAVLRQQLHCFVSGAGLDKGLPHNSLFITHFLHTPISENADFANKWSEEKSISLPLFSMLLSPPALALPQTRGERCPNPAFRFFSRAITMPGPSALWSCAALQVLREVSDDYEVFVFDDGSSDDSREILAELKRIYPDEFWYETHETPYGYGGQIRAAIHAAAQRMVFLYGRRRAI